MSIIAQPDLNPTQRTPKPAGGRLEFLRTMERPNFFKLGTVGEDPDLPARPALSALEEGVLARLQAGPLSAGTGDSHQAKRYSIFRKRKSC